MALSQAQSVHRIVIFNTWHWLRKELYAAWRHHPGKETVQRCDGAKDFKELWLNYNAADVTLQAAGWEGTEIEKYITSAQQQQHRLPDKVRSGTGFATNIVVAFFSILDCRCFGWLFIFVFCFFFFVRCLLPAGLARCCYVCVFYSRNARFEVCGSQK